MKIRRHVKYLALFVLESNFFTNNALAGRSEIPFFSPWTVYIRGFSGICVGSFDYQGIYVNASGIPVFVEPIASNFH